MSVLVSSPPLLFIQNHILLLRAQRKKSEAFLAWDYNNPKFPAEDTHCEDIIFCDTFVKDVRLCMLWYSDIFVQPIAATMEP